MPVESENVGSFLARAAARCGFVRERYAEARVTNAASNVCVFPFFGDMRAEFVCSTLLLHRFLEAYRPGCYPVVCSWPGHAALWPYAGEYWGLQDASLAGEGRVAALGMGNPDNRVRTVFRQLFKTFEDCLDPEDMTRFYDRGLTSQFAESFAEPVVVMPAVRPLAADLNRLVGRLAGHKVLLSPSRTVRAWGHGRLDVVQVHRDFWEAIARRLADAGYSVLCWQSASTHDVSAAVSDCCTVFDREDVGDVLAAMRACDVVLDFFGDLHRLAALARCPYLSVQERGKFMTLREHELDDLCVENPRRRYIFSFHALLNAGQWGDLHDAALAGLGEVLGRSDRAAWPPAGERREEVPSSRVRDRRSSRMGVRFVRMPRSLGV